MRLNGQSPAVALHKRQLSASGSPLRSLVLPAPRSVRAHLPELHPLQSAVGCA